MEEARHCHEWPKYRDGPLLEQAQHYLDEGVPEHFGLWATTCIARRHTPAMKDLGDAWLAEMERWTIQDQVSLPYLFWKAGMWPGTFGIDQLNNDLVAWMAHADTLRRHREIVLELESQAINATSRADYFEMMFHRAKNDYERLLKRKSVRIALSIAGATKRFRRPKD
jgi:hypothetical protein